MLRYPYRDAEDGHGVGEHGPRGLNRKNAISSGRRPGARGGGRPGVALGTLASNLSRVGGRGSHPLRPAVAVVTACHRAPSVTHVDDDMKLVSLFAVAHSLDTRDSGLVEQ